MDLQRVPLTELQLRPLEDTADPVPEWVCHTQPGARLVRFFPGEDLTFESPPIQAAYRALLSLQPREVRA